MRWELGSEFHWFPYRPSESQNTPWEPNSELFVCARDALRALILDGMASRGWRRLWVPGYFCQEVVKSFVSTGIQIALYGDDPQELAPRLPREEMRSGDVVFVMNFFGLRSECPSGLSDLGTVETIEDH